jgi:hypothetical protein
MTVVSAFNNLLRRVLEVRDVAHWSRLFDRVPRIGPLTKNTL